MKLCRNDRRPESTNAILLHCHSCAVANSGAVDVSLIYTVENL